MRPLVVFVVLVGACGPVDEAAPRWPVVVSRTDELRPTDTTVAQMWRFDPTETVEHLDAPDGGFRVHFSRAGRNAVPAADLDADGLPDFVQSVSAVYEEVGARYATTWGFRRPLGDGTVLSNGGDGRYDVYLVDFAGAADGAMRVDACPGPNTERCITYVAQENDFAGYGYPSLSEATRILGSHEYFHAVQAAYDHGQDVVLSEGTAVWATEEYDPASRDFENFIGGYLSRVDRSLDSAPAGPVPAYAYGSAIFFRYLSERFGSQIIRELWEHLENGRGDPSEPANQADPT
ncbi:MAG: hypothetical protein JNG84_07110, partial [Archangium sp.]|nr:hypothetical protein [Archangium sp.]